MITAVKMADNLVSLLHHGPPLFLPGPARPLATGGVSNSLSASGNRLMRAWRGFLSREKGGWWCSVSSLVKGTERRATSNGICTPNHKAFISFSLCGHHQLKKFSGSDPNQGCCRRRARDWNQSARPSTFLPRSCGLEEQGQQRRRERERELGREQHVVG